MADSQPAAQPSTPRKIALINQKGGVGKTTTAVNLGAAIAQSGKRVCLIDLDPQAHLTLHLGIEDERIERTVYDLLVDPQCPAEQAVVHARENLDAILAEVDLAGAEPELAAASNRQRILRDKFDAIEDRYDYVLVDCPPSLGLLTLNALSLVNEVVVPMQAHFLALQGVGKLLETVGLVCQSVNPDLRVTGIIICMHETQTTLAKEVLADLDAFFEDCRSQDVPWRDCIVLRPSVRRNIKLAEAPSFGQTIVEYEPNCPGARDYFQLASRLMRLGTKDEATVQAPPATAQPADAPAPAAEPVDEDKRLKRYFGGESTIEPKPIDAPTTPEQQHAEFDAERSRPVDNGPGSGPIDVSAVARINIDSSTDSADDTLRR